MLIQRKKSILPRFKLAKAIDTTPHAKSRQAYKKTIERTTIISLLLVIIIIRIQFEAEKTPTNAFLKTLPAFEVVNLSDLEEELPPPVPIEEIMPPMEEVLVADEIEIVEDSVDIDLNIAFEEPELIDLNSQLEDDLTTKASSYRERNVDRSRLALLYSARDLPALDNSSISLEPTRSSYSERGGVDDEVVLNISAQSAIETPEAADFSESSKQGSIIEECDEIGAIILRPPKSSLALKEYRLWHKLSTQMDRIDKGRIGVSSPNVSRNRNGIKISFDYRDGTKHTISWQKGGKTSIMVIGKRSKSTTEELRRALNALLRLTLN
ncbi:hypothetical protein JXJ21_06620 [candidate division KSB1 bacterium]|nr:hypothetical protein [candidate division KSB1 bacterium]